MSDIDNLVSVVIDNFFINVIKKEKIINSLLQNDNIIKHHKDILELINMYILSIDRTIIQKMVMLNDNINIVIDVLKKYIAYYLFIYLYINHTDETKYITNLLEITRNKNNYDIKINNFFTSESNYMVIKYSKFILNLITILSSTPNKLILLQKNAEYATAFTFIKKFNTDFINKTFNTDNKLNNMHNIIKSLLVLEFYNKQDKLSLYKLMENIKVNNAEYIYIDVVIAKNNAITYDTIEELLTEHEKLYNMTHYIYELIETSNNINTLIANYFNVDDKINLLLNSKVIVPIVDNLLLFHRDNEKYESQKSTLNLVDKKNADIKIKYFVNKIDMASKYNIATTDEKLQIEKILYIPKHYNKFISINYYENLHILNKILSLERVTVDNEYYSDFIMYINNPYINFKSNTNAYHFQLLLNKTITAARLQYNKISWLTGSKIYPLDIIGFMIKPFDLPTECIHKCNNIITSVDNDNSFKKFIDILKTNLLEMNNKFNPAIWLFDIDKYDINLQSYDKIKNFTKSELAKLVTGLIYDKLVEFIYLLFVQLISKYEHITLQFSENLLKLIETNYVPITNINEYYTNIYTLCYKKAHINNVNKNDDYINYINTDTIIKLQPPTKCKEIKIYKITDIKSKVNNDDKHEIGKYTCQHNISWRMLHSLKKSQPNKFVNLLNDFMKKYIIINDNHEYYCKSCGFNINTREYDIDGQYDTETSAFIPFGYLLNIELDQLPEYKQIPLVITNIHSMLDKILYITNISLFVNKQSHAKQTAHVKSIIDIINVMNNILHKTDYDGLQYGVIKNIISMVKASFALDDVIFKQTVGIKLIQHEFKKNIIYCYIVIFILSDLNIYHILQLQNINATDICNYNTYIKFSNLLFKNNKIIITNTLDTDSVLNYNLLSYVIYLYACVILKYKLWYFTLDETNVTKSKLTTIKLKIIIDTILYFINCILYHNKQNILLQNFTFKFISKLNNIYMDKNIVKFKKIYKLHSNNLKIKLSNVKDINMFTKNNIITKHTYINLHANNVLQYKIPKRSSKYKLYKKDIIIDNNIINDKILKITKYTDEYINEFLCKYNEHTQKICSNKNITNDKLKLLININNTNVDNIDKYIDIYNVCKQYDKNIVDLRNNLTENYFDKLLSNINIIVGTTFIINTQHELLDKIINVDLYNDTFTILLKEHGINVKSNDVIKDDLDNLKYNLMQTTEYNNAYVYKHEKQEIYINNISHVYLGYKEHNKFNVAKTYNKILDIKYSLKHKLHYMSFDNIHYINSNINDILITRMANSKNILFTIKKLYNNLFFKKNIERTNTFESYLINKYISKFENIKYYNIFSNCNWLTNLTPTIITNDKERKYIHINELLKIDINGNFINNYIISEIDKLINNYADKIIKINILHFIIEIIDYLFNTINNHNVHTIIQLKQFDTFLNSSDYMYDVIDVYYIDKHTTGIYNDHIDPEDKIDKNTKLDLEEEAIALDVEVNEDGEQDFEDKDN